MSEQLPSPYEAHSRDDIERYVEKCGKDNRERSAPAWKDAPDVAGLWIQNSGWCRPGIVRVTSEMLPSYLADLINPVNEWRYYGPIPEDTK